MNIIEQKFEQISEILGDNGTYKKEESIFCDEIENYSVLPVPVTYKINIGGLDDVSKSKIIKILTSDNEWTCELLELTNELIRVQCEAIDKLFETRVEMARSYSLSLDKYWSGICDKLRKATS